jgi:molybdopterin converting factor small subunit
LRLRVRLVGFPEIRGRWGTDSTELDFEGSTVGDLLQRFQSDHADPAGTKVLGREGRLDPDVQLIRNGREWLPPDRLDETLSDGDEITLVVLVAGG